MAACLGPYPCTLRQPATPRPGLTFCLSLAPHLLISRSSLALQSSLSTCPASLLTMFFVVTHSQARTGNADVHVFQCTFDTDKFIQLPIYWCRHDHPEVHTSGQ